MPSASAMMSWLDRFSHQCEVAGMMGRRAMQASIATKGRRDHQGKVMGHLFRQRSLGTDSP